MSLLYREEILEHYRNPQNFGALEEFTARKKQANPFCGDEIEMFTQCKRKSLGVDTIPPRGCIIENISFRGKGCAISIAATSLLTDHVKGKKIKDLEKFSEDEMIKLLDIEVSETRKKCALLGWAVLQDCIGTIEDGK